MTTVQSQRQLQYLGYYTGRIDGIFGEKTLAAIKEFQKENGLTVDGKFGIHSQTKSMQLIVGFQKVVGANVDGYAGSETTTKTKAYQKANGLPQTGIADKATREKITGVKADNGDWWKDIKYFERDEFKCKCGGKYCNGFPVEPKELLLTVADRVREHFGKAIHVSSGVRCNQHNANVDGKSGSRHKSGKAMDFRVIGYTSQQVLDYVQKQPEIRYSYAIDGCYVHMDIE